MRPKPLTRAAVAKRAVDEYLKATGRTWGAAELVLARKIVEAMGWDARRRKEWEMP